MEALAACDDDGEQLTGSEGDPQVTFHLCLLLEQFL